MRSKWTLVALASLVLLSLVPSANAQDWAKSNLEKSPRHLEWITVKNGKRDVKCFIAYPEVKNKATAVVIVHEIFGLSDWIRNLADELAAAGFIAIAPDLLSDGGAGTGAYKSVDDLRKAVSALDVKQVVADLNGTADYVAKLPAANGKVAATGYCWGGTKAWAFANANRNLKGTFVFYGTGPSRSEEVAKIAAPVYGFYGENDARVNATIDATKGLMEKNKKTFDPVTYEGAGHGFMRAGEAPDATLKDKEARKSAWKRFTETLGAL